jgi:trk system potassium uptake protein TrkA
MIEINPLPKWVGKNMMELNVRKNYNANVIASRRGSNWKILDPAEALEADDLLLIVVERKDLHRLNK